MPKRPLYNADDYELLYICGHDAVTAEAKREIRLRYPTRDSLPARTVKKKDEGTFFVANLGSLEGIWAHKQNGKTTRARMQGEKWEEFKRDNPAWHKEGKE